LDVSKSVDGKGSAIQEEKMEGRTWNVKCVMENGFEMWKKRKGEFGKERVRNIWWEVGRVRIHFFNNV
jgi:hypothetical protein